MCVYYVMLGTARFSAVLCGHGSTPESPAGTDYFAMRLSGILLAMLSLVLSGVTYLSLVQNIAVKHHEIMMITIAAYTFFKLGIAVTRAIRQRKDPAPLPAVIRSIGYAEAAASVRASDVTATYRPVYYNNNVASLLMDTQTVNFRYTLDGAERTGQLTLSTPSIAYDSVNKQLRVGMSISKVVLGGEEVKSFKPVHFYMQPSEKKN